MIRKLIMSIGLLVALSAVACGSNGTNKNATTQQQEKATYSNVTTADLSKAIEEKKDIVILDVRTPDEVAQGHVEGAQTINVYDTDFDAQAEKLDKSKPIYVYCRSGKRSMAASEKLVKLGFKDVRNVLGGFNDWNKNGYPVAK